METNWYDQLTLVELTTPDPLLKKQRADVFLIRKMRRVGMLSKK